MEFVSQNPYSREILQKYPFISDSQLLDNISKSKDAFSNKWNKLSVQKRCDILTPLSKILRDRSKELGEVITLEMGKPLKESIAEIEKIAWLIDYYIENADTFLKPKIINTDYQKSYLQYDALGGILGIMPWNYPFWQVFRFAIPTLIAGNTVLVKHAPNVPQCALEIEALFNEVIGISGVYQNLFVDIPQIELVMQHDFIQGVSLTGSERAGRSIGALAGKNLKRSVLELGGNDPYIICSDSDIEKALDQFVISRMSNNGQICIAAKRLLVQKDIYVEVKTKLIDKISQLKIGNPMDASTDITCLARVDLKDNLNKQMNSVIDIGAKLLYSGDSFSKDSCAPVVLEIDASFNYDEEIFGPVAVLIKFNTEKELLEIANSTKYGLAASIWSENIVNAQHIANSLEVGNVAINKMVASDPRIPFGGTKASGYGREMAEEGIKEFVNVKSIVIA